MSTPPAGPLLFGRQMVADPYSIYHLLRSADPVHWEPALNGWVLTRYGDCVAALRDPRVGADAVGYHVDLTEPELAGLRPVFDLLGNMMLFSDPPKHTRLRGLVNRAFTPRAVEAMRASVQRAVDRLLDRVEPAGRMDVLRDLAAPLPTTVIGEMLGVPSEDASQLRRWTDDLALLIGNVETTPDENRRVVESVGAMVLYFREAAARRRLAPSDDLLSALVQAEDAGDRLAEAELLANAILLLGAGHETTTNLIGNGTWALLRHPDQLRLLRDDPSLVENAVEELLRFDSPVQLTSRLAHEDLEIAGRQVKQGQRVYVVIAAANRDPEVFPEPDRLDVTRRDVRHLSFSHGAHFCLGAPLARLEGQVAFATLLRRLPDLRLAGDPPEYRANFGLRGLKSLAVAWS